MELRIWSLCGFLVVLAVISHCSGNITSRKLSYKSTKKDVLDAHVMERRNVDNDDFLGDEGIDDEAQKDEGNEEEVVGVIQTEPKKYNVESGLSVRLACVVSPASVPVVNWDKLNGNEVVGLYFNKMKMNPAKFPSNKTEIISEGGVHDLVIHDLDSSDSGEYRCSVSQEAPVSVVHSLRVGPRIVSLTATNNGEVPEGSDLVLTCKVEGLPPPQIIWSRVGSGQEGSNGRLKEGDGTFSFDSVTIQNVKGNASGKYYCYAFNNLGSTQREIDIKVLEKPHAHVHRTEINTGIGDHAIFQCTSRGDPMPEITWFKDNVPVLVDNKHFFISKDGVNSNLTVIPAGISDFGTYTCLAHNYHGVHNRSAELVQRPVIDEVDVTGPKLSFKVHSHLPLEQVEVQLMDETGNINKFELPLPKNLQKTYDFSYEVSEAPGTYQAYLRAKNDKEWSRNTEPIKIKIVFLQNHAHSVRHSVTLVSSAFMYLLIRML
ncbi:protein amalgam-like isoform X2 [Plodia interpunctella]|uniref:protein amalgam-like isoform X2 n=1 Tax=Plodia interpunctella TaxID=58824 RepID=UPI0023680056|nr:protein amalgam-like isoform X2 [Plodia interpunctella]